MKLDIVSTTQAFSVITKAAYIKIIFQFEKKKNQVFIFHLPHAIYNKRILLKGYSQCCQTHPSAST